MKKTITIIGSGMMGSALAFPAFENGNEVRLVGTPLDKDIIDACRATNQHPKFEIPFPKGIQYYQFDQWKEAVKGADFVIGGVSSFGVDWFLNEVLAYLDPALPVLSVTKGLINLPDGTLISYPAYWETELAKKGIHRQVNAIGGPCTSYELVAHDQTEVAFCGKDTAVIKMMKEAMQTSYYHISTTNDVIGLESAVALKNAYALGVAMTIGLVNRTLGPDAGLHYNSQAAAFYQATKEMTKLLRMQGADEDSTVIGIGDLYVTVYGGRTRKIGILLGEGKTYQEAMDILAGVTLESLVVARRVAKAIYRKAELGMVDLREFPLMTHVNDVLDNGKDAQLPWESFTFDHTK
ncbi:MAG: glycerol-3-phosphate dehydrogenase [Bacteroidales bacterium]|jgi:glycerol-3-phosphate dehydrogenase (NAD(P)+)|nr:glycerol-3-phosphate dehydrogenase [Bacteroidales bacterium]MBQ2332314.1 glycerol-3-phosphate dehydrogenase [Bacteroidales bacterium]MBQ2514707.1 glycerol-3-phosphate dehydrogenase [Bacteroidales bacterium]MBR1500878.1 glycerol-3-phosphate dehydrogenase [Bacteroidales bacterium]MBR1894580.1 glycerol-3-phosphate dehydrogenase [Bacteroidales bacterium]